MIAQSQELSLCQKPNLEVDWVYTDFLILGGGVAGLAAANRLADLGLSPVIVEAGTFPAHRVCGEFFSHECHAILKEWGVLPSQAIHSVRFRLNKKTFTFPLPQEARGMSRYAFDKMLLDRALGHGASCFANHKAVKIDYTPNSKYNYRLHTQNGRVFYTRCLILGTGKGYALLVGKQPLASNYLGIKKHFNVTEKWEKLEMIAVPSGYMGISPIEGNLVNAACLVKKSAVQGFGSPEKYIQTIFTDLFSNNLEKELKLDFGMTNSGWLVTEIPEFHHSSPMPHSFSNLYLIGDAAAGIAPISGQGLAMAVTSGVAAAEYSTRGMDKDYQDYWTRTYPNRLRWAKRIHGLLQYPFLGEQVLRLCSLVPSVFKFLYYKTRS